jgi:tetratricopeptide (TPR) repeat protein
LLGAARTAVKQGNYDQAVTRYQEFFRRFNDDPAIRQEYAGVLVSANRLRQAAEQFEQLIAREPGNLKLRIILGDILVSSKEYQKAICHYLHVIGKAPDNLEAATKLARAHAFNGDVIHALQIYDRFLAHLQPEDENLPLTFPALLLDLERPSDALPFLRALRVRYPDDVEILADLVRCYTRLGDRQQAIETLETMAARAPRAFAVRQSLGDTLYQSGDYEMAGLVYAQILQVDPDNGLALVGTARVKLQMYHPELAQHILTGLKPSAPVQRILAFTWAEYHQVVGEYIEAKRIYRDLLCADVADYEGRVALAALFDYIREFEKAKAEYSKVPPAATLGPRARLGFAATLYAQRFFHEAIEACKALLAERPEDGGAMALMARSLAKSGHLDQAVALSRAFLQNNPRCEAAGVTVHFALGKILLDAGHFSEAMPEYEWLLARHAGQVPESYYGLARALEKLGIPERARHVLESIPCRGGDDARTKLLLADLFTADLDDHQAVALCQVVLQAEPKNLAALIRLADAQQRMARFSAHIDEAVQTSRTILELSAFNVRGHLALARSLAVGQQYPAAVAQYDRLIALDPSFTIPQREKARVLFSDHQFAASAAAYQQMLTPSADQQLQAALDALAKREPRVRPTLELLFRARVSGKALQAEVVSLAHTCGAAEVQAELQRILADYEARLAEENGARLEGEAKDKKDIRNYEAIPVYKALVAAEPGNEVALFDLGQVYGALKQNHNELSEYDQLLTVEPLHREGLVAQERSSLELQPQFHGGLNLFHQSGRDGLARISTAQFPVAVLIPCGDENEFVQLGYARVIYKPTDDPALDGNIFSVRAQDRCGIERLLLFGQLNYEQYPDRLHDRPTFEAGATYDFSDCVHGRVRGFLEYVLQNGETLRQDIYRTGMDIGADVRPSRTWEFGGMSRLAYYSDVNTLEEVYLYNNYYLCFPPHQLKLVLDADFQDFAHQTTFTTSNHNDLHGLIHPYFSPNGFVYYETRIEWTHWLSRDYFVHSNQCYYSLQYAFGFDSNMAVYNTFRALANFDVKPWLSIGADANQILSPVYKASQVMAYIVIRFPCCQCHW